MSFATDFTIASPGGAYTDANGAAQVAAANTPRFDHTPQGAPLGLLVQGYPEAAGADIVALGAGVVTDQPCVVLHQYMQPDGQIVSRAKWTKTPNETVAALLNAKGWHRSLILLNYVPPIVDGQVTFAGVAYRIGAPLAIDGTGAHDLAVGGAGAHILTGAQ